MTLPRTDHDGVLHLLPAPVAVIGAACEGVAGGLTASWLTRVTTTPPRLLVSIAPERFTHGLIRDSGWFSVSIPREGRLEEARLFGLSSRRDVDKWARIAHVRLGPGIPALATCAARLLCRLVEVVPLGDHDGFLGEVTESAVVDGGPALPMRSGDYRP